jgi:hypothetical protein
MPTLEFYLERAAEARRDADGADLANVRDRCLSAAVAWDGMADRLRRTQDFRDAHEATRVAAAAQLANTLQPKNEDESEYTDEPHGAQRAPADPPTAP